MQPTLRQALGFTFSHSKAIRPLLSLMTGLLLVSISGCGNLFFYPSREHIITPDQIGLRYENVSLETRDGETLHGWLLPAIGDLRGTVYFLHGNAENISTHIASVMWLPAQGYQVFLLDYRGYGLSTGNPDISTALLDAETGYHWLLRRQETRKKPLFLLGQSLGAALTVTFSSQMPDVHQRVQGVVIDAAFTSFRGIAREKLSLFWLTWPFQYPLSWLIPGSYDPVDHIGALNPIPLLIIHSEIDEVIPVHHGKQLFDAAAQPKWFLPTMTAHNGTFAVRENRQKVLEFLESRNPLNSSGSAPPSVQALQR